MSNVALNRLPLFAPIFACIEEGRVRLVGEGNYGEHRVSDQGSASGHTGLFWLSFISILINISREKLRTFILLSLFFATPTLVNATTYYVAPNGSDSSAGTQAAPFGTLQRAHDIVVAGDTIYMRGGTYRFAVRTTLIRDGTSGNPIKVLNFPKEAPAIDGINQPSGNHIIYMNSASWWHIKGLELKNAAVAAIFLDGNSSNNIIESNNAHHNMRLVSGGGVGAISMYGTSGNNTILNNDVHDNNDAGDGGAADGIGSPSQGTGNVIRGNRAWRNSDDGIDMWTGAPALIENNWAWENGYTGDNLQPRGNGNGFKLGGAGAGGRHTLKNNLAWKNRFHGFNENSAGHPLILYNNTGWDNPSGNYYFPQSNTFRNNVSFGARGPISGSDTFNSWTLGVTVSAADFSSLDDTIARGPRNGALPTSNFLRLVAGSDLIDRGVNVGIAYAGSAPDLGAYEHGESRDQKMPTKQ